MSYLDESNYLGSAPQAQMQLPQELLQQLAGDMAPAPQNLPVPEGWISLPGGIVMKKSTAILLGLALAAVLIWWYTRKKKK